MAGFLDQLATATTPDRVGRVRILVVGNTGSGKTCLAHFLAHGTVLRRSAQTVGCNTFVKALEYPEELGPNGHAVRTQQYFVELWDVGGHERYQGLRSLFYSSINGVILVHDMSFSRSRGSLLRWAAEVARAGTFTAPYADEQAAFNTGGLRVPCLLIGTKADLLDPQRAYALGIRQTWLGAVQAALNRWQATAWSWLHAWLSKLPWQSASSTGAADEPLAHAESGQAANLPPALACSALTGAVDTAQVDAFFLECIQRRYYPAHHQPSPDRYVSQARPSVSSTAHSAFSSPAKHSGAPPKHIQNSHMTSPSGGGHAPMSARHAQGNGSPGQWLSQGMAASHDRYGHMRTPALYADADARIGDDEV